MKQLHRCGRVHVSKAGPSTAFWQAPAEIPPANCPSREQKGGTITMLHCLVSLETPGSCSTPSSCSCIRSLSSCPNQLSALSGQPYNPRLPVQQQAATQFTTFLPEASVSAHLTTGTVWWATDHLMLCQQCAAGPGHTPSQLNPLAVSQRNHSA